MTPRLRPLRGLRYTSKAGDLASLITPPYDVIPPRLGQELLARNPYNFVRLELPAGPGEDRFAGAARTLGAWRGDGILARDPRPAFYLHEHSFDHGRGVRRGFLAGLEVSPPEEGKVRPHERTLEGPRAERLGLLRALETQTSPVLVTYRPGRPLPQPARPPDAEAIGKEEHHRLWRIDAPDEIEELLRTLAGPVYIADGHHRYLTALRERDEARAAAAHWTGEEARNFVLAELVPMAEMAVFPWHRLIAPTLVPADLEVRLGRTFVIEDGPAGTISERLAEAGRRGHAFGLIGRHPGRAQLLTVRDTGALARALPAERAPAWRSLDVAVFERIVLADCFGIDPATVEKGALRYTRDLAEAESEVAAGRAALGLLLNPTPVEQVVAVADAGELMPQKSTCFHPKLPAGLVLYPLADEGDLP